MELVREGGVRFPVEIKKKKKTYLGWFPDFLSDHFPLVGLIFFDGLSKCNRLSAVRTGIELSSNGV